MLTLKAQKLQWWGFLSFSLSLCVSLQNKPDAYDCVFFFSVAILLICFDYVNTFHEGYGRDPFSDEIKDVLAVGLLFR